MDITYIVVCGGIASGKTEFCRYATQRYGGLSFTSQELFGTFLNRGMLSSAVLRAAEQEGTGMFFRRTMQAFERRVQAGYNGPRIVYHGGLRLRGDLFAMWEDPRIKQHCLVWLKVDDRMRHAYYMHRNDHEGEDRIGFADFMALNDHPHEQDLSILRASANVVIENTGMVVDYHEAIDDFMGKLGFEKLK